jgi:hypothetical protein
MCKVLYLGSRFFSKQYMFKVIIINVEGFLKKHLKFGFIWS